MTIDKEKFQNKYRIKSIRLPGWDYSEDGYYFITICTKNRINYFGRIKNERMHLSLIGEIVKDELVKTQTIRKNVVLDEYIIMPNHLHAILVINNHRQSDFIKFSNIVETPRRGVSTGGNYFQNTDMPRRGVSTGGNYFQNTDMPRRGVSIKKSDNIPGNNFKHPQWKPNCLGSIICQFKSVCTKKITIFEKNFAWQARYYEEIICSESSLYNIREYIHFNIANWKYDSKFII